ncbi:MAG TPA: Tex family protein [Bacteroidales bacterium]|nr:Tex family protein [Bacteroidales bacterium]
MVKNHSEIISQELGITLKQVENTIQLLTSGATVPFIARYRKEATGCLDEVQIINIRDRYNQLVELDKRRESIINSIQEQNKLTDELKEKLINASSLSELEDIYLPYRPKRKTKASIAIAKGLEPLAKIILAQNKSDINMEAEKFIDQEKGVESLEDAISGARDIIAEIVNENQNVRKPLRELFMKESVIRSRNIKGKEKEGENYKNYFEWEEKLSKAPSHRILAMLRGEREEFLRINIFPSEEKAMEILVRIYIKAQNESSQQLMIALKDSYKRLLAPSLETEVRNSFKEKADAEAIRVFAENLRQLLLTPPLGQKNVLAIDPGFRTGCKLVCLDKQGKLLHNETIYPHPPENEVKQAVNKIQSLVNAYKIEAIAIGNGTAGRETERLIRNIRFDRNVMALVVNESGASVYSASAIAREEFPEYDITVRGSVSIGRRLMDPLAELVKIDPKSIGVGQYQHDVNQNELQKSLDDTVVSCVNAVGVEVNTSSKELLKYVSGIGPALAQNLITYRDEHGAFRSREELKKVKRFSEKVFEQAAGFLRIQDAVHVLDNSAVHPESYHIVKKMAEKLSCSINDLIEKEALRKQIKLSDFVTENVGLPTLQDIMSELSKPGRDPREKFDFFEFDKNVHSVKDLKVGMVLPGIITNITAFGAFVDIGVHQDGLVHISHLANKFVSDPNQIVKLNQKVNVKVLDVDIERKRISLSMKEGDAEK